MSVAVSNYVSPESLTLWLTEKQNEMYGDMRNAIDMSNQRSEMQSALGDIAQHLEEANQSGDFRAVNQEIALFLSSYGSSPEFEEVSGPLVEINASIGGYYAIQAERQAAAEADALARLGFSSNDWDGDSRLYAINSSLEEAAASMPLKYSVEQIKSWTDALEAKRTFLSQQDQLAMLSIQELNGKVNQSEQLVSNLLASRDQTLGAVIANIRG